MTSDSRQAGELTNVDITPAMMRAVLDVLAESGWLRLEAPEPTEALAFEILEAAMAARAAR
jgi:hypothetical protein